MLLTEGVKRGLIAGFVLDRLVPDPRRGHPVALFGAVAGWYERRFYRDSVAAGALFVGASVLPMVAVGSRLRGPVPVALATWAVLGGSMLGREAERVADALERGDLDGARTLVRGLCGREVDDLDAGGVARAVVESVAENTSDAVVGPLLWGALCGPAGLVGFRAVNTLDAMVGYRDDRYERFGKVAARSDDVAGWAPSRLTALLAVAAAPVVGGSPGRAWRVWRRDRGAHPSPNAGQCEAAFAGALGLRLGGTNVYGDRVEHRPVMGEGPEPAVVDIRRAVRLARVVNLGALLAAVAR